MRSAIFPILLLITLFLVPTILASEAMPSYYQGDGFGQNHYYAVSFDEEGEAAVAAKLTIQNTKKQEITDVVIEIPGESVRIINAIQEARQSEKKCSNWDDICIWYNDNICEKYAKKCYEWYYDYYSYPTYHTIDYDYEILSKSVKYTFHLPVNVSEQQTTTILLYYKAIGYVDESLGVYNFDFETAKLNYDTNTVRVSITVQDDLYFKGGKTNIDFKPNFGVMSKTLAAEGARSDELQSFSDYITYSEGYVKEAYGLDPWESFHVKGKYARSWFALYKVWIIIGLLALATIVWGTNIFLIGKIKKMKKPGINKSMKPIIVGFFNSLILIGFWFLLNVFIEWFNVIIYYQYQGFLFPLIILLASIIILVLTFGIPIYMGIKYGLSSGIITFLSQIFWMFVFLIVIAIFLAIFGSPTPIVYGVRTLAESVA